ncbi:hypothetical protein EGI26_16950 [Lacihabitans sp. CCS-44]|uniref:hypothetical protein n=1 Tax=Lacihabitans sp. CCS-44 TaxID=2487331 RepID=UPI0020CBD16F|nr:hypothetical protein [Lacihabitans sp. CCS-44]MCP9756855.1 hypothetical protein [Lacihabitans sp. CCS-44]
MKHLFFGLIFFGFQSFGQDTLTYDDILSNKYKKLKNYSEFTFYRGEGGFVFKKGDKLKVLTPENPNNITQDLFGSKLYGNFTYLIKQKGLVLTVPKTFSGEEITIDNIYIFNLPILKKIPVEVYFECKLNRTIDGLKTIHVSNIDKAISQKEVEIVGVMTREKALEILKKQKELLDLQLISQEEFDKKKVELGKFILGTND